ncbi:hypothetical protein [Microbacterium aurum]|uniref:hypothetical protein n=1 Tax=Microbacterium aurum TaxID=36805 RepID=UPI0012F517D2|nr:hypothetical protein [Microbacterium aurum]MBM7826632.1 hypothetical protein [Microbacterium aurum]
MSNNAGRAVAIWIARSSGRPLDEEFPSTPAVERYVESLRDTFGPHAAGPGLLRSLFVIDNLIGSNS